LIKESHKTIVFSKIGYLILAYILIQLNYGLLGIAIANLISSFVNRISSYLYFYDKNIKKILKNIVTTRDEEKKILKIIFKNSSKLGVVSIGAFLINKSSVLIMSKYVNLKTIAEYGITLQIISLLVTVSSVLFNTYLPLINYLRIQKKEKEIKDIFSKALCINYVFYIVGSVFLIFFGNRILSLLKSNTLILDFKYLVLLLIMYFLEMNHSMAATIITTKNTVPFLKPALFSGVAIVILMLLSLEFTKLNLYGVILSQGLVQLVYNNWKWPVEVSKDLSSNYFKILKNGVIQILYGRTNG
ncbi:MAG: O-unit flippase-like protein, partial [Fusobacteriaceae bacterium]